MEHNIKLTNKEKINRWLDICDFFTRLMEATLTKKEFKKKLQKIRKEHIEIDCKILEKISKYK